MRWGRVILSSQSTAWASKQQRRWSGMGQKGVVWGCEALLSPRRPSHLSNGPARDEDEECLAASAAEGE